MKNPVSFIGKVLLVAIFLFSGIRKIFNFSDTVGYMSSKGIPIPEFFLVLAILCLILGSLSILTGFKAKFGYVLIILFLIPVTLIFHNGFIDENEMINMMKNTSILGAIISLFGVEMQKIA